MRWKLEQETDAYYYKDAPQYKLEEAVREQLAEALAAKYQRHLKIEREEKPGVVPKTVHRAELIVLLPDHWDYIRSQLKIISEFGSPGVQKIVGNIIHEVENREG